MIEIAEVRPIPGKCGYQATVDGKIVSDERRIAVGRLRQKRGGRSYVRRRYVKRRRQRILRAHKGRVRLRQKNGTLRAVPVWRLIAVTWICRIMKTDRAEYLDGNRENIAANNLRIVRSSGKVVTLSDRRAS